MKTLSHIDVVKLIKSLIEIPSVSGNEANIAAFVHEYASEVFPDKVTRDGNSVIVTLGNADTEHRLLLCSHIDTVMPSDGWTRDPYKATVEGSKIYGLGANDALASCVSMFGALSQAQELFTGNAGVTLALVEEEETGNNGFCRLEPKLNYSSAIFGEPTQMRAATEMRGYMRIKLLGTGKNCHASRPWEGKNAILDLVRQLDALSKENLKDDSPWGQATIEPTIVNAGNSANQIPDHAEAILDIRPTPAVNNDKILEILDRLECTYEIIHNHRRPMRCDPASEVMQAVEHALPGQEKFAFGGSCDMAFSTSPSIVMGVGKSVRSHAADEFIETEELADGTEKYLNVIQSYVACFGKK